MGFTWVAGAVFNNLLSVENNLEYYSFALVLLYCNLWLQMPNQNQSCIFPSFELAMCISFVSPLVHCAFVLVITGHCDDFGFSFMAISHVHSNSEVKFQRVGVLPIMENTTYIFFQWLVHLLQEWSTCNFSSLYQYQYRVKQTRNYLLSSNIRGGEESAMIDCCSDRKHSLK